MQGDSPKRSVCVLDLSEDELRAVDEWIRRHRGERQMTKLTKDMLGLKMDKHFRTEVSTNAPIFANVAEWVGFVQALLESNHASAQEMERLSIVVRQKTEEAQKYKTQLTNVLVQFKADKDKNAQVITRLSTELESKCKELESLAAAKGQADQSKSVKLEETFTKLFEKGREIQELKEQNGSLQAALARSESKAESLCSQLRQLLSMDRGATKLHTSSVSSNCTFSALKFDSPTSTIDSPRLGFLPPPTLHSLVTNKSIRRRLLSFLPLDSFLTLRHLDLLTYRSLSLDFSLQQALHALLTEAVQRQHKLSQQTIEAYKQMGYKHGDKYTSYIFYKHAYLRNTAVAETFAKSVTRCAGIVHSAAATVKDKVEKGAVEGGIPSQTAMRDALIEEDNKAKQAMSLQIAKHTHQLTPM